MKKLVLVGLLLVGSLSVMAQSLPKVGPNGIVVPNFTQANRLAISTPATGLIVYQTDGTTGYYVYTGSTWVKLLDSNYSALTTANNLSDLVSTSTARTNLGLGTLATQAASSVDVTGGTVNGTTIGATTASIGKFTTLSTTGQVGIGTSSPTTSAALDISSTTGALLLPRLTTAQRDALTPSSGMLVFNTDVNKYQGYYSSVSSSSLSESQHTYNSLGGSDNWQQFVAGSTGNLTTVKIHTQNAMSGLTLNIYEGTGLGGTLLLSQTFTSVAGGVSGTWVSETSIPLSTSVAVVSGNSYTISISNGSTWHVNFGGNLYAAGVSSFGSNDDFAFETYIAASSSAWTNINSNAAGDLVSTNNLSDLSSASTARTNLGLGTLATSSAVTSSLITDGTIATADLAANSVTIAKIYASGTASSTTYLRGDGTWSTVSGGAPSGSAGGDLSGTYPNPTLSTSGVTSGTYGSATQVPSYTVDAKGRITAASNVTITGITPGGSAGGDLTGTYPNPTIANSSITSAKLLDGTITNSDISTTAAIAYSKLNLSGSIALTDLSATGTKSSSTYLRGDGTWATVSGGAPSGSAGGDLTGTYPNPTLATSGVTSGTYGSATQVPAYTVDTKGRITAASNITITGITPGGSAGGDLTGTYPNPTIANSSITSAKILNGTIANADISTTAAIAYSKLNLTGSVAITDLSATGTASSSTYLRGDGTWATAGGSTPSFGYVYYLNAGQVVPGFTDVTYSNNGSLSGITHTAGSSVITIPSAGNYKIEYSIRPTLGNGAVIALAVNGVVDASTKIQVMNELVTTAGTAILYLTAGDIVTLRNQSSTMLLFDESSNVGSQMTLTKID